MQLRRKPRNKRFCVLTQSVRREPSKGGDENSNYDMGLMTFAIFFRTVAIINSGLSFINDQRFFKIKHSSRNSGEWKWKPWRFRMARHWRKHRGSIENPTCDCILYATEDNLLHQQ